MLILECSQGCYGRTDGRQRYYIPSQLCWRGDKKSYLCSLQEKKYVYTNLLNGPTIYRWLGNASIARKYIDTDLLKTEANKGGNYYLSDFKSQCNNGTQLLLFRVYFFYCRGINVDTGLSAYKQFYKQIAILKPNTDRIWKRIDKNLK